MNKENGEGEPREGTRGDRSTMDSHQLELEQLYSSVRWSVITRVLKVVDNFFFLGEGSFLEVISTRYHHSLLAEYRTQLISSRVRLIALLFALFTPLWIIVDAYSFPRGAGYELIAGHLATSAAFAGIAVFWRFHPRPRHIYLCVGTLFAIASLFFIYSRIVLSGYKLDSVGSAMACGYAFLPFLIISEFAVFPFTIVEILVFSSPLLGAFLAFNFLQPEGLIPGINNMITIWILLLIATVGGMASLSQLQFMRKLFEQSTTDPLTGALNRRSGEQYLSRLFSQAARHCYPLSVAFLDLDDFKMVNDRFGHDAGDAVLVSLVSALTANLRHEDVVIRWGGEEFVVVLPYATASQARDRLAVIARVNLPARPDGQPVTWSGGVADAPGDAPGDAPVSWRALVDCADARLLQAKAAGKACLIAA